MDNCKHAMIFAAGLGTRLGRLSHERPKALLQLGDTTLIDHCVNNIVHAGFHHIVVNVHHHADMLISHLQHIHINDVTIEISNEKELLLDTGGGLKKASSLFNKASHILLHNVDVVSDVCLRDLWETHICSDSVATLAVKERPSSRYLLFDDQMILRGWKNTITGDEIIHSKKKLLPLAFSGIHVVSSEIFNLMPQQDVFSMTTLYLDLCQRKKVKAWRHDQDTWVDVGKPESILPAEQILQKLKGGIL